MEAMRIPLTEEERQNLSDYIEKELGIRMPPVKHNLLQARLSKRLQYHNLKSFSDYYRFFITPQGQAEELRYFVDTITTNKTDFFREDDHYSYLVNSLLPKLHHQKEIKIWSSACSTGEEPYTLSMLLDDYRTRHQLNFDYKIYATDISVEVLEKAFLAEYTKANIEPIPLDFRKKYLLKHHANSQLFRIVPHIRSRVVFRRLNLLHPFELKHEFDIIFCRNVLIYFDKDNQRKAILNQYPYLKQKGVLFISHAESLMGHGQFFLNIAPSVYQKTA